MNSGHCLSQTEHSQLLGLVLQEPVCLLICQTFHEVIMKSSLSVVSLMHWDCAFSILLMKSLPNTSSQSLSVMFSSSTSIVLHLVSDPH